MNLLFLCLALIIAYPAHAKVHVITGTYTDYAGGEHTAYKNLQAGDELHYLNGEVLHVDKILGQGGSTTVAQIREYPGKALRFNTMDPIMGGYELMYMQGYRELYERGVNVNKIHEFKPGKYFVVERLPNETLTIAQMLELRKTNPYLALEMESAFLDFAKSLASFASVSDLHAGQMVYSVQDKKWILFDWLNENTDAFKIDYARMRPVEIDMNPFDDFFISYTEYDRSIRGRKFVGEHAEYLQNLSGKIRLAVKNERWRLIRTPHLIKNGAINENALKKRNFIPLDCHDSYGRLGSKK